MGIIVFGCVHPSTMLQGGRCPTPTVRMTDRASIVEDFWLAIARNDRPGAEAVATCIEAPLVSISGTYSFELVEGKSNRLR
jgi:hypothetical protein